MANKFTPGPWRVEGRHVLALKQKPVCECPQGGILHAKVDTANANLIAAAPEMYEALKKARSKFIGISAIGDEIDAIIAKANGGQQ